MRGAIQVHRASGNFIVTTGGRVDHRVASAVLRASQRTWLGRTRWLPQNLVTVTTIGYFVASAYWFALTAEWRGWGGAFQVALIVGICALFERDASKLRPLSGSGGPPPRDAVLRARRLAGARTPSASRPTLAGAVTIAQSLFFVTTLYVLTIGRRSAPPKRERRRATARLPRLRPAGAAA